MAIHHPTPPLGGGERPRLPSAQEARFSRRRESVQRLDAFGSGGPVTQAIRAMRSVQPHGSRQLGDNLTHGIRALSRADVEDLIGGLIDLLDAMDGDTDIEHDEADGPEGDDEREGDPAEDGIGDYDGLAEQVGLALSQRAYA